MARPTPTAPMGAARRYVATLEAALLLGEWALASALIEAMRAAWPGHLGARTARARLAMRHGDLRCAEPLLRGVLAADPAHWPARWALGLIWAAQGDGARGRRLCREAVRGGGAAVEHAVRTALPPTLQGGWRLPVPRPQPVQALWEGALADWQGQGAWPDEVEDAPDEALVEALGWEAAWQVGARGSAARRAARLRRQCPALLGPRLLAAGAEPGALARLDPAGAVAQRLALPWVPPPLPDPLQRLLATLPADVLAASAANDGHALPAPLLAPVPRLPGKRRGAASVPPAPAPALPQIEAELARLGQRLRPGTAATLRPALPPAEAIVVARGPLQRLYGAEAAQAILVEAAALAAAKQRSGALHPQLIIVDEEEAAEPWGRAAPDNPAAIRQLLDRVEARLPERLTYVLLVGGHEVIPHHRLPNPVDDHDDDVPSDNPYAASGDNYLIPTRAVGRLPGERESPVLLLGQLQQLRARWEGEGRSGRALWEGWLPTGWPGSVPRLRAGEGWGISAEVWAAAAQEVFRTLDPQGALHRSPPATQADWADAPLPALPFFYFNLHGVEDNGRWYGHAAPDKGEGLAFPVALTPAEIAACPLEGAALFSEACYGANPFASRAADSIALTALGRGCALFVGSTKTAYASFAPPLMAADLLAAHFWRAIAAGAPGGLALQQAKVRLAEQTMQQRGFLDVEEQKTLTSFLLLGDPSLPLRCRPTPDAPLVTRSLAAKMQGSALYQVRGKGLPLLDPALVGEVERLARPFLLGSAATLEIRGQRLALSERPAARAALVGRSLPAPRRPEWHVTLSQQLRHAGTEHRQVVTLALSPTGTLLRRHLSR